MRTRSRSAGPQRSGSSPTKRDCGTCWPATPPTPDGQPTPEERVDAHQADPTDPWAADLPAAGWETATHGNVHQPSFDDLDDDCWTSQHPGTEDDPDEEPVDDADQAWHQPQRDDHEAAEREPPDEPAAEASAGSAPPAVPAAFLRPSTGSAGSVFDLRPFSSAEQAGCGPQVVIHVHVSDQTLIDQHGVVRTAHGPITLDQFRQWLTQADPTITIRPVLDHTIPHTKDGPPGQTGLSNLGPLTRTEHRAKTFGGWQARQPDLGTYLWRSPDGLVALTTNQGTLLLGDRHWAQRVWTTACSAART